MCILLWTCQNGEGVGAAWNVANVQAGSTVAIFGLGALGLAVSTLRFYLWFCFFFPEVQVIEDFLSLELGSSDAILGMQWLRTLGGIQANWEDLTLKFKIGGSGVIMKGDSC